MSSQDMKYADDENATVYRQVDDNSGQLSLDMGHYITVVDGTASGLTLELGLRPITVGRHKDNDLIISDPFVSGHHCRVAHESGVVVVTDLNSTNGCFMNGQRVNGSVRWPDSDSLQVGNQVLRHVYQVRRDREQTTQLSEDIGHAADYVASLLPSPIHIGLVTTEWVCTPSAKLGGDNFSYHWLDAERFVFYLIDVCGHGVGAALHSVSVSSLLRQQFLPGVDFSKPSEVLTALNRALPMEKYGSMYFTLWYGVYHPESHCLTYASAGHPPGLLFSCTGRQRQDLATDNPPVGVIPNIAFQEMRVCLGTPCELFLYSDGVFEIKTKSNQWWSCDAFVQYVQQQVQVQQASPESLYQTIRSLTRADRFEDDFTLLRFNFHA